MGYNYLGYNTTYGSMLNKNVRIAGYGNSYKYGNQITRSWGTVKKWSSYELRYINNTEPGDSGAPIFTVNSQGNYIAVGVHLEGFTIPENALNGGIPMTVQWPLSFIFSQVGGFENEGTGGFELVGGTEDNMLDVPQGV